MVPEEMDINVQVHRTFASFSCPRSVTLQHKSGLEATLFLCQNCMECTKRSRLEIYMFHSYFGITGKNLATPGIAQVQLTESILWVRLFQSKFHFIRSRDPVHVLIRTEKIAQFEQRSYGINLWVFFLVLFPSVKSKPDVRGLFFKR